MPAILTKYLGPGNVRGSRIKATCCNGSLTIGYPHQLDSAEAHASAARALVDRQGWTGRWHGEALPDGRGYAFVRDNPCFTAPD